MWCDSFRLPCRPADTSRLSWPHNYVTFVWKDFLLMVSFAGFGPKIKFCTFIRQLHVRAEWRTMGQLLNERRPSEICATKVLRYATRFTCFHVRGKNTRLEEALYHCRQCLLFSLLQTRQVSEKSASKLLNARLAFKLPQGVHVQRLSLRME